MMANGTSTWWDINKILRDMFDGCASLSSNLTIARQVQNTSNWTACNIKNHAGADNNTHDASAAIASLYAIVCVLGLAGNLLVMYVIIRYTKMKTATNIYIFNLALADALVTSTLPFQSVNYLLDTWPFGQFLCKVAMSIDYYNMFTSIFTLTSMSVDRYIAVCHPVKALDVRTPSKAKIISICIWIVSSGIGIPIAVMASAKQQKENVQCLLDFPDALSYLETFLHIFVFVFAFIFPVLIITVCYSLMVQRLRSIRLLSGSKEKDRNLRRITRMVLIVVAVFIICWTPIHIFVIVEAMVTLPSTPAVTTAWHFCIALGYTNSCLNPVLYAFLDHNFKRCFHEFCLPVMVRGNVEPHRPSACSRSPLPNKAPSAGSSPERMQQPA